ncbi:MAG: squalene synthase HpnC [Mariprofundaceae bacterium]|nr:squalene synthase HpnC [Mariprofundaceae bacterium]
MRIAQQHYENFPTASRLIRRKLRPAVAAIYAFARAADDMADEGNAPAAKRLKQIDAWESLLERCTDEQIDHPVFLALGDAINTFHLPVESLHDLLIAFRMDVSIHAYATRDELMFYCRHSANPVGRLMLALHGVTKSEALHYSDALCTALQLTNFWQDLKRDIPNGRCYLAQEWLEKAGLSSEDVIHGRFSPGQLKPALAEAYTVTRQLFQQGAKILPLLPFRLRLQIAATLHGGMAILQATTQLQDPLNIRPALSKWHWYRLTGNILATALRPSRLLNMEIA